MKRRDFISQAAIAAIGIKMLVLSSTEAAAMGFHDSPKSGTIVLPNADLQQHFIDLLQWMKANGWSDLVTQVSALSLDMTSLEAPDLTKVFQPRLSAVNGCDDFIGNQLISPGKPQESLLYHLLASPRVKLEPSAASGRYPSLEQIDLLENVIYALSPVAADVWTDPATVLAVFAYEYRPSSKTPHGCYADLVFSRSGFSRIGTQPVSSYDAINRCFTNKPDRPELEKEIAVTPVRYGLFLARLVAAPLIENNDPQKGDNATHYLLPFRKLFNGDSLLEGYDISFSEAHLNERLRKLCLKDDMVDLPNGINFKLDKQPFIRRSSSGTAGIDNANGELSQLVDLRLAGSSVLVSSHPRPLVWPAFQQVNGRQERLRIKIPVYDHAAVEIYYSNRRYSSLKVLDQADQHGDALDVLKDIFNHGGPITHYNAPRNAPMFVNIREEVAEHTGDTIQQIGTDYDRLLEKTDTSYWVGLFEDNICHGCVYAGFKGPQGQEGPQRLRNLQLLPAFSIVTAPDFFPMVESYDMKPYTDLFLSGGVQDVSGARLKADPNVFLPGKYSSAFPNVSDHAAETETENTILAVITGKRHPRGRWLGDQHDIDQARTLTRSNYLPDSATLIFYPGWDVTYSNNLDGAGALAKTFYSTMGLGLPFMEDSKLCAAANGMWAAASPDASRTFRGTLSVIPTKGLTPTAVPLLDNELGFHAESPAVKGFHQNETTGWDGEQGPFLKQAGGAFLVSFTDINRSDYVQNALHGMFDMSLMRKITTADITDRMAGLQKCYEKLNRKKIWLVSAEKVPDWNAGAPATGLPVNFIKAARPFKMAGQGSGYLYVFAETTGDIIKTGTKRVSQKCKVLHICLIGKTKLTIRTLKSQSNWAPDWT